MLTVSGGSVGTIVDDATGWVVDPSAEALAAALAAITHADAVARGAAARASYEQHNTPAAGLASLLAVYDEVTGPEAEPQSAAAAAATGASASRRPAAHQNGTAPNGASSTTPKLATDRMANTVKAAKVNSSSSAIRFRKE